jgi:hypothetical protein
LNSIFNSYFVHEDITCIFIFKGLIHIQFSQENATWWGEKKLNAFMVYQNIARIYKQDDIPNSKHLQSEVHYFLLTILQNCTIIIFGMVECMNMKM